MLLGFWLQRFQTQRRVSFSHSTRPILFLLFCFRQKRGERSVETEFRCGTILSRSLGIFSLFFFLGIWNRLSRTRKGKHTNYRKASTLFSSLEPPTYPTDVVARKELSKPSPTEAIGEGRGKKERKLGAPRQQGRGKQTTNIIESACGKRNVFVTCWEVKGTGRK